MKFHERMQMYKERKFAFSKIVFNYINYPSTRRAAKMLLLHFINIPTA